MKIILEEGISFSGVFAPIKEIDKVNVYDAKSQCANEIKYERNDKLLLSCIFVYVDDSNHKLSPLLWIVFQGAKITISFN